MRFVSLVSMVCGLALAAALAARPVLAGPVLLDFTNPAPWAGAHNQTSFSTVIGDLTVTLTAHGSGTPKLSFNNAASERQGCMDGYAGSPAHNLVCGGDGLGIGDDEITEGGVERIKVTFSRPIRLVNVELLDLFNNNTELEKALISLDEGATWAMFTSNNNLGGYYSTNLGGHSISRIIFKSYSDAVSDYAVARLSIYTADVPEPAAGLLVLVGLAGLKRLRRRSAIK
ncbi:MAG: PEP-CTERM sorting domain-containing protein [Rhodospirillaceae bacterium]|nr:PEP-CTERM sorting domain-containing protein [Rhodospirillaceae bacterium]